MGKWMVLGLGVPALARAGFGHIQGRGKAPGAKVICCGKCAADKRSCCYLDCARGKEAN